MHCRTASEIHRGKKGRSMGKGPRVLIISSLPFLCFSILCVKDLERFVELQYIQSLWLTLAVYSLSRPNSQIPLFLGLH